MVYIVDAVKLRVWCFGKRTKEEEWELVLGVGGRVRAVRRLPLKATSNCSSE